MNIIDEAMKRALADPRREIFDESVHDAVRAAIEHAVRRCAEVVEGGGPAVWADFHRDAILRAAGLEA